MDDTTIIEFSGRDTVSDPLTDLLRKGARELLQAAVEAERDTFLADFADRRTSEGRAAVVRSGYHPERAVQTGLGPVTVRVPKVRAKDGQPVTFRSALVPPYVRKAKSIEAALPWLYLKGISTGEMNNVTPADVYFGRAKAILKQRERIKRKTRETRRLHHRQHSA